MPYDTKLAERMRTALADRDGVAEKKMFGGICWMLHGHMLCGVEVGRFMFRVGKDRDAVALAKPGATPMDITGKPMRGFVWVDAKKATGVSLAEWVDFAAEYVGTLSPRAAM